ncbi:MAG: type II secretion system protein GspE [Verrucomicrobia bacterium]|nr:MAG: type II secretion system protein GspE [Verrucomicrobiota bacterium]
MFESENLALYELFKERGLVDHDKLQVLHEEAINSGRPLARLALDHGVIDRDALLRHVADYLGWEYLPQAPRVIDESVVALIDGSMARMYGVVPLRADKSSIDVLARDPFNSQIVDDLTFALRRDVRLVVTSPEDIDALITQLYGAEDESIENLLAEIGGAQYVPISDDDDLSVEDIEAMASEAPIVRFVNLVLSQAIREKASDIHFEPFEEEFKIRYRIDGALYEMAPPPKNLALPIISRLKVLANLNISERRTPQDGRIKLTVAGRPVDLRVSTLPTQFGESVVLRVLDRSVVQLDLDNLGMPDDVYRAVKEIINRPNGIFVVTGPTGSGKTTTLYSALREVNTVDQKILTAEDPVEYDIEGIMQVSVNPQVGLTFASALRSFLRQDPDIIMVGEIRDLETAQIAIQASLTGHLVLSTLHTNDCAGAVTRLVDMGVEPFLISSALEAVMAQRLVRRICMECRSEYEPGEGLLEQLNVRKDEIGDRKFFYGPGCEACHDTGYRGRMGIFELMWMNDALRELITRRAPSIMLRQRALAQGMRTLRDDGLRAIFAGATTIEEVIKYT